jgi:indole-3-glycerol phosphate synthase
MSTILDTIAEKTRIRVAKAKITAPFDLVRDEAIAVTQKQQAAGSPRGPASFPFEQALKAPAGKASLAFICEVKKASPSKGIIAEHFPYLEIATEYEAAGAAAISVLTEPEYFLGSDSYLREIAAAVTIPVLRKDFIVDPYQIYEAKLLGAGAVLLICALLDTDTLSYYIGIAHELGLSALVEIHNQTEAEQALQAGARIIGINNRNLKTFTVDMGVTADLRSLIPPDKLVVAESGIRTPDDMNALKGINAVLIGESLMRSENKKQFLSELQAAYHED